MIVKLFSITDSEEREDENNERDGMATEHINKRDIQSTDHIEPQDTSKRPEQDSDPQTVVRPPITSDTSTVGSRVSHLASRDSEKPDARSLPKEMTRIPHVSALVAGICLPRQRLLKAAENCEEDKALKILGDEASIRLLDQTRLDNTLWSVLDGASDKLTDKLLEQGANNDSTKAEETILIHVLHLEGL